MSVRLSFPTLTIGIVTVVDMGDTRVVSEGADPLTFFNKRQHSSIAVVSQ